MGPERRVLDLAGPGTERVDLEGRTVLPGFYDSHLHMAGSAGEPTGIVLGRAAQHILREALGVYSPEELAGNIASAIPDHVLPYGITSYADPLTASNNQPSQLAYQRLMQREGGLPVRVNLMIRLPVRSLSLQSNLDLMRGLPYEAVVKVSICRAPGICGSWPGARRSRCRNIGDDEQRGR